MKVARRLKPRSWGAQVDRMRGRWPEMRRVDVVADNTVAWIGPLRGFQMSYRVQVQWNWIASPSRPLVFVLEPTLRPRLGERFIDIPHLIVDRKTPERSALCLFDPAAGEWDDTMWIADTTVPWASEWLHHYELWHVDGVWRGANAPGPISVGAGLGHEKERTVHVEGQG